MNLPRRHKLPLCQTMALVMLGVLLLGLCHTRVGAAPVAVDAVPIVLDPATPGRRHFGALTFLSGFALRSAQAHFGGWSGLALSADGAWLYAVSDHGYWLAVPLHHDPTGRLTGFGTWDLRDLLTPSGQRLRGTMRDAEALVREPDGAFLVAFEHRHRLWRYPRAAQGLAPPQPMPVPPELTQAPGNGGIEAMTRLHDGTLLLLTEEFANPDGSLKGWLMGSGYTAPVSYLPSWGFQPTDLATLANGDVLLLERRYNLFGPAVRLQRLTRESIQAGAQLRGEKLTQLALPLVVDNFEGIAVHEDVQAGALIYLISDDNYNPLQRTLLLQFRLGVPES